VSIDWSGLWASTRSGLSGFGDYCIRVGDGISQLINLVFFLGQNPNESLSGRSYRERRKPFWGKMRIALDAVFLVFEQEHCKAAYDADIRRAENLLSAREA
jgi:hypothetical protein